MSPTQRTQSVVADWRSNMRYYYGDKTFRTSAIAAQNELTSNKMELAFVWVMIIVIVGLATTFLVRIRHEQYANDKLLYDVGLALQNSGKSGTDALLT